MIIWLPIRWWYGSGWIWLIQTLIIKRSKNILDEFSIKSLTKTLFAPYRQTYSSGVKGSIGDRFRGLIDNIISRFVGFFSRLLIITSGLITLALVMLISALILICWPLIPIAPIISLMLFIRG